MEASPSALRALASHLETVTQNVRSHGGHGWTYDEEVEQLRAAAEELNELRKTVAGIRRTGARPRASDLSQAAQSAIVDAIMGAPPQNLPDSVKAEIKAWAETDEGRIGVSVDGVSI